MNIRNIGFAVLILMSMAMQAMQYPPDFVAKYMVKAGPKNFGDNVGTEYRFISSKTVAEAKANRDEMTMRVRKANSSQEVNSYAAAQVFFSKEFHRLQNEENLKKISRLEKENADLKKQLAAAKEAAEAPAPPGGPQSNNKSLAPQKKEESDA